MSQPLPLFFHQFGKGDPLLILHGFMGMSDNWVALGKRFAEEYQVIIPDMRNHGRSPHSAFFGFEEMMVDVIDLLNNLGIPAVNILGHSMGGRLAMMMAVNYPERIRKCEVVDISPFSLPEENQHLFLLQVMQNIELKNYRLLSEIEKVFRETIKVERLVLFCMKNIKRNTHGTFSWKLNVDVLIEQAWKMKQPVSKEKPFAREVLFIKGGLSTFFKMDEWPEILKVFPLAVCKIIENAGHWVHVDAKEELYQESLNFFKGTPL